MAVRMCVYYENHIALLIKCLMKCDWINFKNRTVYGELPTVDSPRTTVGHSKPKVMVA